MGEFLPEGEALRKAVRWISDRRLEDPDTSAAKLVDEASRKFDLGPRDEEFLWSALTKKTASP